jgi:hypothetical protein
MCDRPIAAELIERPYGVEVPSVPVAEKGVIGVSSLAGLHTVPSIGP